MANQLIIAGLHQLTVSGLIFGPLAARIRTPDELKQYTTVNYRVIKYRGSLNARELCKWYLPGTGGFTFLRIPVKK